MDPGAGCRAQKSALVRHPECAQLVEMIRSYFRMFDIRLWLLKNGNRIIQDPIESDLNLKVLLTVMAVDQSETLHGTPQMTVIGVPRLPFTEMSAVGVEPRF